MSNIVDLPFLALLIAVVALFVWYFWHVAKTMVSSTKTVSDFLDGRATRQRAELEREAKFGPHPLWYRAAQKVIIAVLFVGSAWLVWDGLFS